MLYFRVLCFLWAAVGIGSRIAMAMMGKRWAEWEETQAYSETRPGWVVAVALFGYGLVVLTWYVAISQQIPYGWVLALLVTSTTVKVSVLLFNYVAFREFLQTSLRSRSRMAIINGSVLLLSAILVWMGLFLYR
jgi:hypothetical protein